MVVSMRPIPKEKLATVYQLSNILGDCHAAPIAIGRNFGEKFLQLVETFKRKFWLKAHYQKLPFKLKN